MKLYHGSNKFIDKPKIIVPDRRLDFGTGFYLTSSYEQAKKWAVLTTERRGEGKPIISIYDFDEEKLNNLSILKFDSPSKEWLLFVSSNRNNPIFVNDYDLVIGPVANDQTMPVLRLYFAGIYDENEAIKRLLPQKLKDQYTFKTDKALSFLKYVGGEEV